MESEQKAPRKGRKLGSSRRRQTREPADGQDAPAAPEPGSWSSRADAELQAFFRDCGATERGFVTREDLAGATFSFLGGEEPQMIFDWADAEQRGRLSLEEFSSGLKNIFGSSPSTHRLRGRRPRPSQRVSLAASFPALEEAEAEEREAFLALTGQLGTGHFLPEQTELWQLWGRLRQEEPQLAGDLEGLVAKMSSRLQEVQADTGALELSLRKRDADHQVAVQRLYAEMEQQISREKQQLQAQSDSRALALNSQMEEALEAKEREVQRLAEGQRELEAQLHHLSSSREEAGLENQKLWEDEQDLAGQLEEARGRLQVTRRHLDVARAQASWQVEEEQRVPGASEKAGDPQAVFLDEAPLPGLFGDNDDWGQLLGSFGSAPHRAPQLSWSPPPTPRSAEAPTPRVVRQISISEPCALLPSQEPPADPGSPLGVPPSTQDRDGANPAGQDIDPEHPVEPHGLEPEAEPGHGSETHFPWGSGSLVAAALRVLTPLEAGPPPQGSTPPPQAPAGPDEQFQASDPDPRLGPAPATPPRQGEALHEDLHAARSEPGPASLGATVFLAGPVEHSQGLQAAGQAPSESPELGEAAPVEGRPGGLREAGGQVLSPDRLPARSLRSLEEEPKAQEGKPGDRGGQDSDPEQAAEAHGLETGHPQSPQQDPLPASPFSDSPQAPVEAEGPAPGNLAPAKGSAPLGAWPRAAVGPQEPKPILPSLAELEAHPRPPAMTDQAKREAGSSPSKEPRTESRPEEDPGNHSREVGPASPLGDPIASEPQADPEYLFHVIFLGDSNVGKTSFLHLLHQNAFATQLTATVGVDFRVKTLLVDSKCFALQLWDTAGQERYHSMTRQLLRKADGVVLMYDVTSQESFAHVRYWLDLLRDAGAAEAVVLLLGNKMDCEEQRQVPTEAGRRLAQELGVSFGECSSVLGHNILEPIVNLARSLKVQEDRLKGSLVEVAPKRPQKRGSCCS